MTIKELKQTLNKYDDNLDIIIYASTQYQGAIVCQILDKNDIYEDNVTLNAENAVRLVISCCES